jgi:hypothetical protein
MKKQLDCLRVTMHPQLRRRLHLKGRKSNSHCADCFNQAES